MSQWPGVSVLECVDSDCYEGTQDALMATGLFRLEWFPGQPGNGTTSSIFVFTDAERNGYILKRGAKLKKENGYGRVQIIISGSMRRAWITLPPTEAARRKALIEASSKPEEWKLAKEAHTDKRGVLRRWKDAVNFEIGKFERLCTGEIIFTEMPDVRIQGDDLARVKDAVETLRAVFQQSNPVIPDVFIRSNVYSIRDGAHRGLKKTG